MTQADPTALDAPPSRARPASAMPPAVLPPRVEFVRLHHLVEAQRAAGQGSASPGLALMFVAATAGQGVSTLAEGYAAVCIGEPGATLLLRLGEEPDLDRRDNRPGLVEAQRGNELDAAIRPQTPSAPAQARLGGAAASADELRSLLARLRARFRTVVIDAPAVLDRPDALPFARLADGIVLVAQAARARVDEVQEARLQLERAGGIVIGSVFNRAKSGLPAWLERLL